MDGLLQVAQTDGGEQRAQKLLGVSVALLGEKRHPGSGLLQNLFHGVMAEQVGQTHLSVAHCMAERHAAGDLLAAALAGAQLGENEGRGACWVKMDPDAQEDPDALE